jgi:hypothetical protein
LFTKLQATRGSEAGHVHYYTRIGAVIYGYVRHLFGTQVCERRRGERDRAEEMRKGGWREEIYVRPAENFCMYTMDSSRKNLNENITTKDNVV